MSKIEVKNLTFSYEGSYEMIFDNVSFTLDTQWKLGLISRNGRGKTTLLHLLEGKYPYTGKISAMVDFTYYPYEVKDNTKDTVDVMTSMVSTAELWEFQREMNYLELEDNLLYRPFHTLSNGEQTKMMLIAMFLKESAFFLIDEPTNHLDVHSREVVSRYLNSKRGFIVVSHDRDFLDGCVNHILSINKTDIRLEKGNFSSWWLNKERQDQFELSQNQRLAQEVKKLKQGAAKTAKWSHDVEDKKIGFSPVKQEKFIGTRSYLGEKSRKMMARSKSLEQRRNKASEEKSKLLKNIEKTESLKIHPLKYHSHTLIAAEKIGLSYEDNIVFENLSFQVESGDKIALVGKNGAGKTSLLKLLLQEHTPTTGQLRIGSQLKISYIPQDASHLKGTLKEFIAANAMNETLFKTNLKKCDFNTVDFEKDLAALSEGQKKKVLLACSLSQEAHLFLWDEPLNYIDVYSVTQLENLLESSPVTMIFVEHDHRFSQKIAAKWIQL